ncbi:unnamed protein product [Urochloa decumbens]|uniref:DUF7731 domain-containing protein n=1 Tax=Urochloa decumbens TaxID=240449 RepID=A0ABC8VL78_9POAL
MASQRSVSLLSASLAFVICILIPCCSSSKEAMELFERACHCFDDPNVRHASTLVLTFNRKTNSFKTNIYVLRHTLGMFFIYMATTMRACVQIYGQCAEEFRLNAEGAFHVQRNEVDSYCGGPCLEETKLALQCVEEVAAQSFRFSNGASVLAVRQALGTGCGYGPERGTFEIRERRDCVGGGGGPGEYYSNRPRDHAQEKPVVAGGGRYYGEGEEQEQPYEQGGAGYGEGEEHCSYGHGDAAGLAERRGFLQMVPVLVASAALLLIEL